MIQTRKQKLKKSISVKKKSARSNSRHSRKNKNTKSKRYKKKNFNTRKSAKKSTQTVRVHPSRLKKINEENNLSQPSELDQPESRPKSEVPKKYFLRQRTQKLSLERKNLEKIQSQRGGQRRNLRKRKSPEKDADSKYENSGGAEQMKSLKNSASRFFLQMFGSEDQKLIRETAKHAYQILHESGDENEKQSEQAEMKKNLLMSTFHIMSVGLNKDETKTLRPYEKYLMYNPFGLSKVDNLLEGFAMNPSEGSLGRIEKLSHQFHHFYFFSFLEEKVNEMKRKHRRKKAKYPEKVIRKLEEFIQEKKQKAYSDLKKRVKRNPPKRGPGRPKNSLKRVNNGRNQRTKKLKPVAKEELSSVENCQQNPASELSKMQNAKKILETQKEEQNESLEKPKEEGKVTNEKGGTEAPEETSEKEEKCKTGMSEEDRKGIEHSEYINKRIRKVDSKKNVNDVKLPHIKKYIGIETDIKCPTKRILVNDLDQLTSKANVTGDVSFSRMSKEKAENREGIPSPRVRPRARRNKKFRLREIRKKKEVQVVNAEIDLVEAKKAEKGFKSYGVKITKVIRKKKRKKRRLRTLGEQKQKNDIFLYKMRCKELRRTKKLNFDLIDESPAKISSKNEKPKDKTHSPKKAPIHVEEARENRVEEASKEKVEQELPNSDKSKESESGKTIQATSKQIKNSNQEEPLEEKKKESLHKQTQNKKSQPTGKITGPKSSSNAHNSETPLIIKNSPDFFSEIPESSKVKNTENSHGTQNKNKQKLSSQMAKEDKKGQRLNNLETEKQEADKEKVVADCLHFIRCQFESFFESIDEAILRAQMGIDEADDNWEETCQEEKEYIIRSPHDDSLDMRPDSKLSQSRQSPPNRESSPKPQDPTNKYNKPTAQTGVDTCGNMQSFFSMESPKVNALKCNFVLNSSVGNLGALLEEPESGSEEVELRNAEVNLDNFYRHFGYLHYGNFPKILDYMISKDNYLNYVAEIPQNWLMFYSRFETVMMIYKLQQKHKLNTETVFLAVFFLDKAINYFFRKFHELKQTDVFSRLAERGHDFLMTVLNTGSPPHLL